MFPFIITKAFELKILDKINSILFYSILITQMKIFLKKRKRKNKNLYSLAFKFYGIIYVVKTIPLCRGMAWRPFQKDKYTTHILETITEKWIRDAMT